jgi:hypothetical protein
MFVFQLDHVRFKSSHFKDLKLHITQQQEFTHQVKAICSTLKQLLGLDKKMTVPDTLQCLKTYIERQIKRGKTPF